MAEQIRVKAAPAARAIFLVWLCAMAVTGYSIWQAQGEAARTMGIAGAGFGTVLLALYLRGAMRGTKRGGQRSGKRRAKGVSSEEPEAEEEREAGLFTDDEMRHRFSVWEAMAELWLDAALTPGELKFIAQRLAQSKYDPDELEAILFMEVAPVVHENLRVKEGSVRKQFHPNWLREKIIDHLDRHGHREVTPKERDHMAEFMTDEWNEVQKYMKEYYELGV